MTDTESDLNTAPATDPAQSPLDRLHQAMAGLKAAGDSGASWFFWIAVLSLVNTAILHLGGDRHFIVGLAITTIVDAIASVIGKEHPGSATIVMMIAVTFSVMVSVVASLFGWLSRKRYLWVFGIGMFLYFLDGLLYLLIGEYLSGAFHAYALYSMLQGFRNYQKLALLEAAVANAASDHVPDIEPVGFESA